MEAQRKWVDGRASVQLWVPPELRKEFREVVKREERTVAQDLRYYMQRRVEEAKAA